jgi:hypothetical protein
MTAWTEQITANEGRFPFYGRRQPSASALPTVLCGGMRLDVMARLDPDLPERKPIGRMWCPSRQPSANASGRDSYVCALI